MVDLLLHHAPHFIINRIQIWTVHDDNDDEYDNFYGAITQYIPLQGRLDKKNPRMSEIWFLEVVCFQSGLERFNDSRVDADLMDVGSGNRKGAIAETGLSDF